MDPTTKDAALHALKVTAETLIQKIDQEGSLTPHHDQADEKTNRIATLAGQLTQVLEAVRQLQEHK